MYRNTALTPIYVQIWQAYQRNSVERWYDRNDTQEQGIYRCPGANLHVG